MFQKFTIRHALLLAPILIGGACRTVGHSLDELKSVHWTDNAGERLTLNHKFEIEHYGWFSAMVLWGPLHKIPGLSGRVERVNDKIDDPAEFCLSNISVLHKANLHDVVEVAEVVYWAGGIVESDPFPLSRVEGLRVLRDVVFEFRPDLTLLDTKESDYPNTVRKLRERIKKLGDISYASMLTDEFRKEYVDSVKQLGAVPYTRANEARGLAQILGSYCFGENDPAAREALATATGVLLVRGALFQMVEALGDNHERVRIAAANELVSAYGPSVLPRIIHRLRDDASTEVRAFVASLAGDAARVGLAESEPVIEYLTKAARDPESSVSVNAMESLGRLTGVGRQFDADWWRKWYEKRLLERPAGN